jgi:hypothetical protein
LLTVVSGAVAFLIFGRGPQQVSTSQYWQYKAIYDDKFLDNQPSGATTLLVVKGQKSSNDLAYISESLTYNRTLDPTFMQDAQRQELQKTKTGYKNQDLYSYDFYEPETGKFKVTLLYNHDKYSWNKMLVDEFLKNKKFNLKKTLKTLKSENYKISSKPISESEFNKLQKSQNVFK